MAVRGPAAGWAGSGAVPAGTGPLTKAYAEKALGIWRERLGLWGWDLWIDWDEPALEESNASTWRANDYDRAHIRFDPEWSSWDKLRFNRILVHELLHLFTRDVDEVFNDLEHQLHRDVFSMVERRYQHETEGFVDRLAYRIVDMVGVV